MLIYLKISPITIFKKYNCINCHKIIKNSKIPNFIKISYKYLKNKFNKKYLFKKIKFGSKNVWGNLVMPSNKIKNSFLKLIIKWIFNLNLI